MGLLGVEVRRFKTEGKKRRVKERECVLEGAVHSHGHGF